MRHTESPAWHAQVHSRLETMASSLARVEFAASSLGNSLASAFSSLVSMTATGVSGGNAGHMGHAALASISSRMQARRNEVVGFLAASPSEIKARLAGVPIYAVRATACMYFRPASLEAPFGRLCPLLLARSLAHLLCRRRQVVNAKKEFILVSGDDDTDRQMALLFFSATDAAGFEKTLKQENPKLGKSAQVLPTSLEAVYELVLGKGGLVKNGDKQVDVSFRFMPDSKQVMNALELYKRAGIVKDGFVGVPLFQAEGLTVRGDESRFTPLFFSREDVLCALEDTQANASNAAVAELQQKIERVKKEMGEKPDKGELAKRLAGYEKRLKGVASDVKKPEARIDVGSFEDVLEKMMSDKGGTWDDVVRVMLYIPLACALDLSLSSLVGKGLRPRRIPQRQQAAALCRRKIVFCARIRRVIRKLRLNQE